MSTKTSKSYTFFLYILLALTLSWVVKQNFFTNHFSQLFQKTFLSSSAYLMAGISTLFAGSIGLLLHKGISKQISILGNTPSKNILIVFLPVIAFSISGIENKHGINVFLYGFLYSVTNVIYAFTEEFGWRKYLQNALEEWNRNIKYIFIGIIWWLWHFRFETNFDLIIFPIICIGGGFLLGKLADASKSVLPVVAMHTLIILTTNSGNFGKNEIMGIGIVLIGWVIIEQIWKRKRKKNNK